MHNAPPALLEHTHTVSWSSMFPALSACTRPTVKTANRHRQEKKNLGVCNKGEAYVVRCLPVNRLSDSPQRSVGSATIVSFPQCAAFFGTFVFRLRVGSFFPRPEHRLS